MSLFNFECAQQHAYEVKTLRTSLLSVLPSTQEVIRGIVIDALKVLIRFLKRRFTERHDGNGAVDTRRQNIQVPSSAFTTGYPTAGPGSVGQKAVCFSNVL